MTEKDILNLIQDDKWMMEIISTASAINLPQWIIGAGFVRNKVWDYLSGNIRQTVDTRDIDLVYFDPHGNNEESDNILSEQLTKKTGVTWEVVNQCYAHKWNNIPPYTSTEDAISKWPETVTAIGVTQDMNNELRLIAPYGVEDLVNYVIRPTPLFVDKRELLKERIVKKKWSDKWPNIKLDA